MKNKAEKSVSERAVEAQANKVDLATEMGLTKAEFKVISDFNELLMKRIEAAPVEPITAKAETLSQAKFPNNDSAQREIDVIAIEDRALEFVLNSALGYPSLNLRKPAPVEDAGNQLSSVEIRLMSSPGDEDLQRLLAKKIAWFSQMRCQREFKNQLSPVFTTLHRLHRGYDYQGKEGVVDAVANANSVLAALTG